MYRIKELLQIDRKIFHTNDLAVLWKISNRNTLYTTISRQLKAGILFSIYKGLYATVPIDKLDPIDLGKAIAHGYTYQTTESVLAAGGVISQIVYAMTFAAKESKQVTIGPWSFRYRQMKDEFLFHPGGIEDQNGRYTATVERAAADLLYYHPNYHFDVPQLIDINKLEALRLAIGY